MSTPPIAALKDFSTGAQNFVLADDQGHIAYDPHALVPVRNFADAGSCRRHRTCSRRGSRCPATAPRSGAMASDDCAQRD